MATFPWDQLEHRKLACVCCSGDLSSLESAKALAERCELLIAADGGAEHLFEMGLKPDLIVGDGDSLKRDYWPEGEVIERVSLPCEKDCSDGEYAVGLALDRGMEKIVMIGAMGGRLDHSLGQVSILLRYSTSLMLWDGRFFVRALKSGDRVDFSPKRASIVSILPLSEECSISNDGMKYGLSGESLLYSTHALSNLAVKSRCSIELHRGTALLCIEEHQA